jgi:hypothetical protein
MLDTGVTSIAWNGGGPLETASCDTDYTWAMPEHQHVRPMSVRQLDRVASVLHKSPAQAQVTVKALQASFKAKGKNYSFDETSRLIVGAFKYPESSDPDLRYAAEWLKASIIPAKG